MPSSLKYRRMRNSLYRRRRKSSPCKTLKNCTKSRGCKKVKVRKGNKTVRYCRKRKNTRRH